jgi:hypothetical protein
VPPDTVAGRLTAQPLLAVQTTVSCGAWGAVPPSWSGRQPGTAFDHNEREPGAADKQQVDQRVLAQMMC